MMRSIFILTAVAAFLVLFFAPNLAFARGACPDTADRLEEFARCMVPVQGGMRYAGTAYDLDEHHRKLLSSMAQTTAVPPHVMPVAPNMYWPGWTGIVYPMMGATAYVYGRGGNPWLWNWWAIQIMTPRY